MANQYEGSLEHKIKQKFNCSVYEWFETCTNKGFTYMQASEEVGGFTYGTVKKWAKKLGITLASDQPEKTQEDFQQKFCAKEINIHNFLNRKWKA